MTTPAPAPATHVPQQLGRYELLARIASGGMGEIFLARLEGAAGFEKLYVVKRILPHLADDARFRQMLIAEARIAAKLNHANICQVYELGETDGQLYIAMEYLEGVTLLPILRRASRDDTPLALGFVAAVIQQTADALHYAHELRDREGSSLGIVHRDVTPSNLFVTEAGVIKVLDFGIAKAKGASATHTQTGAVKGKYAYMAPEQLRGVDIDRRVDVFALGIALFEMLALRRLFQRKTDYLTFRAVMEQPIADVRDYRPDTPDALAQVVARALDREPAARFDTARQLASAVLDAVATTARPWSQGELGDYIRGGFGHDVGKRAEVTGAIASAPGAPRPAPLPVVAAEPATAVDDEDDDEFPSVETVVDRPSKAPRATPSNAVMAAAATTSMPADPVATRTGADASAPPYAALTVTTTGDPLPFGFDKTPTGTAMAIAPIRVESTARPQRNLLWPIVACGMFVVAGGALVLVWQMSRQPAPTVYIGGPSHVDDTGIFVGVPADAAPVAIAPAAPDAAVAPVVVAPAVVAPAVTGPARPSHAAAVRQESPYDRVLEQHRRQINDCAKVHPDPNPPTAAQLHIDPSGRPTTVSLQPAAVNATALGSCLKSVLQGVQFPKATNELELTFPFHVKPT